MRCGPVALVGLAMMLPACSGDDGGATTPTTGPTEWVGVDHLLVERVRASRAEQPAALAVDDDPDTAWVSGGGPPQWIELDLGGMTHVSEVRLLVEQDSPGSTVHEVRGGVHEQPGRLRGTLDGDTASGDELVVVIDDEVHFIRVTTLEAPSSVAWREIDVVP